MPSEPTTALRILVVDDEPLVVRSLERVLRRLGFEIVGETEPKRALDRVRSDPDAFDLILTDHRMPGLSGLELAAHVHQIRRDLPVVVISAYADQIEPESLRGAGVERILNKPVTRDELLGSLPNRLRSAARTPGGTG